MSCCNMCKFDASAIHKTASCRCRSFLHRLAQSDTDLCPPATPKDRSERRVGESEESASTPHSTLHSPSTPLHLPLRPKSSDSYEDCDLQGPISVTIDTRQQGRHDGPQTTTVMRMEPTQFPTRSRGATLANDCGRLRTLRALHAMLWEDWKKQEAIVRNTGAQQEPAPIL